MLSALREFPSHIVWWQRAKWLNPVHSIGRHCNNPYVQIPKTVMHIAAGATARGCVTHEQALTHSFRRLMVPQGFLLQTLLLTWLTALAAHCLFLSLRLRRSIQINNCLSNLHIDLTKYSGSQPSLHQSWYREDGHLNHDLPVHLLNASAGKNQQSGPAMHWWWSRRNLIVATLWSVAVQCKRSGFCHSDGCSADAVHTDLGVCKGCYQQGRADGVGRVKNSGSSHTASSRWRLRCWRTSTEYTASTLLIWDRCWLWTTIGMRYGFPVKRAVDSRWLAFLF
jgi:hypothetical protein